MVTLADLKEVFENIKDTSPRDQEIQQELARVSCCGKTYIELMGTKTLSEYYKRVDCEKWFCPVCGGKDGKVHKKRKRAIVDHFGGIEELKKATIAQWVFTIPKNIRWYFKNRGGLNAIFRMVKRIIEKQYGKDSLSAYYLHLFGDKDFGYHPHINVHIKLKPEDVAFVQVAGLEKIREAWRKALKGYIRESLPLVDVQYSYRKGLRRILHSIKYMARPTDVNALYADFEDSSMDYFLIVQMKRFRFIRTYGGKKNIREEENILEEIKELEGVAGEPLRYVRTITQGEFNMKFRDQDLERVADGLYRVRQTDKKTKRR